MDGFLVINKEAGYTSRDIVNIVGKTLQIKKIGHTGTLDPMATGVLVLCLGKATKLVELLTDYDKEYIAEITLGLKTDTWDITGIVLEEQSVNLSKIAILEALNAQLGTVNQEVPLYSAIKVKGKRLYEYARHNEKPELPKHQVTIKELELLNDLYYIDNKTVFSLRTVVSKGTYIRSLAVDIATYLDTIGVMSSLRRTRQGIFTINDSYTLSQIKSHDFKLLSIEEFLKDWYQVKVDNALKAKIMNGAILDNTYNKECLCFTDEENKIIAIYKTYEVDQQKIKPWKMF